MTMIAERMYVPTVVPDIMRPSEQTQLELLTRQQLIALLVRRVNTITIIAVRMYVSTVVPDIMRPSVFSHLQRFPRQQLIALLVRLVDTMGTTTPVKPVYHVISGSTAQVEPQLALIACLEHTMTTTTAAHPAFHVAPGSTAQVETQNAVIARLVNMTGTATPVKHVMRAGAVHTALLQRFHVSPVLPGIMRPSEQT